MDRLVGAIDDGLTEPRAQSEGRREEPNICGREIGRQSGHEYCGTHDLRISGGMMRQGVAWWRHVGRIEFERFRAGDERVVGQSLRSHRCTGESRKNRHQKTPIHDRSRDNER
ncbi:hypothetical protein [Bradyrhizobium jicamae]|uniref:hypothetical protein n=1 Tax=Bradyrhizobium jicamae TaxID=280332 RepID=UPI0018DE43D5|nr:hypothetical protein [Bradyrhizobium jicamae]